MDSKTFRFSVIIEQDEDGIYVATVPSLQGCHTQAKTIDELDNRIREAVKLCIDAQGPNDVIPNPCKFIGVHQLEIAV